jgi:hypothetical protein
MTRKYTFSYYSYCIQLLLVVGIISCSKEESINVNELLAKHKLERCQECDFKYSSWKRNGCIYANKKTDSCLIVLMNKKGDTILTHFDSGIASWYLATTEKKYNNYFVKKTNFGKTIYDYLSDSTQLSMNLSKIDVDYPMDSYYQIDTISKKLIKIAVLNDVELEKRLENQFSFLEKCTILALSNHSTYVAKDTLDDKKVYYQINTKYQINKDKNNFVLVPYFSNYIHKMGVYTNNCTSSKEKLGSTFVTISVDSIGQKTSRFDIYLNYYSQFKCGSKKYNYCFDDFVKLEVIAKDRIKVGEKIMMTFYDNTFFENDNFNMIKYKNGDYFIGVLPTVEKEYNGGIFRLDTINWTLQKVTKFNKKTDVNYIKYKKVNSSYITGNTQNKVADFLEEYEIVKVGKNYKLITPNY